MINEAAINAVKHGRRYVNQGDLFESVEVVIAGKEKKDRIMGPKEKKMVAYHEVGHALVTALQKDAEPVQKITIVPRTMGALGYTMQVPEEEKFLMTKNELVAHLVTYMGGRAAEEIVFDSVTTGASNDIEQATKMARAMVTQYGMSEKFGLMGLVTVENKYLDGRASLNCGEETAAQIDQEVMKILKESYDEAVRLLQENRSILDEISQYLYEHETITGKEFMKIFRKLKGLPEPEEKTGAQKAAERFKVEETYVNSTYKEQRDHNNYKEEKGGSTTRKESGSSQKEEHFLAEAKPLPLAQPEQIPAGITILEDSQPQETSVQLKPQEPPAGLTVLEESWTEEETMNMPVLEENVNFRVPKFLQRQLWDVTTEEETASEEPKDKIDIDPSQEEQVFKKEEESVEEELPQESKSNLNDQPSQQIEEKPELVQEMITEELGIEQTSVAEEDISHPLILERENELAAENFLATVEPVTEHLSEEQEEPKKEQEEEPGKSEVFREESDSMSADDLEKAEPVSETLPEQPEEPKEKHEEITEELTDHPVISREEAKKKSHSPKIRIVRAEPRKAVQRNVRGENVPKSEAQKVTQAKSRKKTIVKIEPPKAHQEKPQERSIPKEEPRKAHQEKPQERSIPR